MDGLTEVSDVELEVSSCGCPYDMYNVVRKAKREKSIAFHGVSNRSRCTAFTWDDCLIYCVHIIYKFKH
jgi:hypothetical protein